jgi:hypothetical protein
MPADSTCLDDTKHTVMMIPHDSLFVTFGTLLFFLLWCDLPVFAHLGILSYTHTGV